MTDATAQPSPLPQGRYVPARRHGALIFTAGMTPRRDGVLAFEGPIRAEVPLDFWKDAVVLACANALSAAGTALTDAEALEQILSMTVYLAVEPGFSAHARLADFASDYLHEKLGEPGIGTRAAIGVAALPDNAPVEISLVASVCSQRGQMQ